MQTSFLHGGIRYNVRERLARDVIVAEQLRQALLVEWSDRQADGEEAPDTMPMYEWQLLLQYVDVMLTCSSEDPDAIQFAKPSMSADEIYDYMQVFWNEAQPSFWNAYKRAQLMVDNGFADPLG